MTASVEFENGNLSASVSVPLDEDELFNVRFLAIFLGTLLDLLETAICERLKISHTTCQTLFTIKWKLEEENKIRIDIFCRRNVEHDLAGAKNDINLQSTVELVLGRVIPSKRPPEVGANELKKPAQSSEEVGAKTLKKVAKARALIGAGANNESSSPPAVPAASQTPSEDSPPDRDYKAPPLIASEPTQTELYPDLEVVGTLDELFGSRRKVVINILSEQRKSLGKTITAIWNEAMLPDVLESFLQTGYLFCLRKIDGDYFLETITPQ